MTPGSPRLELVVAASENDVIGRGNQLPWHLPADLRHFKRLTIGQAILMGRRTFESIGRPLPERLNLVLSRRADFAPPGCTVVPDLAAAGRACGGAPVLMVIGGAEVFRHCLPFTARIHLTLVHARIADGDTCFSEWRAPPWREVWREPHAADDKNALAYTFMTLERAGPSRQGG